MMMTLICWERSMKTLEEYVEEKVVKSDEDDDINDGGDIKDISSDDE